MILMALSGGALGRTSVACEHGMTCNQDVFFSCIQSHLNYPTSLMLSLEKNMNFAPDGKKRL